jgi:Dimethlysulfonioproprionate lyase
MTDELIKSVKSLVAGIAHGLELRGGEGVSETLFALRQQKLTPEEFRRPEPMHQAVCRHLRQTLVATARLDSVIAQHLVELAPHLRWLQSSSYTDELLGEGFSQNYAWSEIIGPQGIFHGSDFLLGLLLLGPHRHYKDHYHPAPELYWPLTAPSDWKRGDGPFVTRLAGEVIWHPSMVVHATITHAEPLLAIWAWTKDVETGARLV